MKFCEAMEALKNGSKVTREAWGKDIYFVMDDKDVKAYRPKLSAYLYNEDIMVSEGWMVGTEQEEFKFCDIIPCLRDGYEAKMKDWTNMFIYLDQSTKSLVLHSMDIYQFSPQFEDFLATDWIDL